MRNKMVDLRNHLFATLEGLQDAEKPMDLERARAISEVAQVVINAAKVEVAAARALNVASLGEFFGVVEAPERRALGPVAEEPAALRMGTPRRARG